MRQLGPEAAQVAMVEQISRAWDFCGRHVEAAIENPGEDHLGEAVRLRRKEPTLFTDNYLHSIACVLVTIGSVSSIHSLALGIRALVEDGTQWERLRSDPGLIPNAIEEIRRYCCPLLALARLVTRDTEIRGRRIPAGSRLLVLLASGNRDESVFPDGDVLDIDRENAREHLTFGHGPHHRLGASLARLQMKIVLEELIRRLPHMQLADGGVPGIVRTIAFRGLEKLAVQWD